MKKKMFVRPKAKQKEKKRSLFSHFCISWLEKHVLHILSLKKLVSTSHVKKMLDLFLRVKKMHDLA